MVLCIHADDTPSTDLREAIYLRHGLLDRLSVARLEADGSLKVVSADTQRMLQAEAQRWAAVAKATGLRID
jgi:hypothetical protein